MKGAIIGDIIGSPFEFKQVLNESFAINMDLSEITDDSILTIASATAILADDFDYSSAYRSFYNSHKNYRYGPGFVRWAEQPKSPDGDSFGNGSAMRVSPISWAFDSLEEVMLHAKNSALPTHGHPEGIKGAQAVASAIFLARKGSSKSEIQDYIESEFGYNLNDRSFIYDDHFICQTTVPRALNAFMRSDSFEDAIRKAIILGIDTDTLAAIAGSIAEAFYQSIPLHLEKLVDKKLSPGLNHIVNQFYQTYQ
jgi:ADP-ribosylglycohydrolase